MLKSVLKHYWFTGAATVAVVASAAYFVAAGEPDDGKSQTIPKNKSKNKLSGLINEGNTCFINATLQALASCPIFFNWINSVLTKKTSDVTEHYLRTTCSLNLTMAVINNQHPTIDAHPYNTRQLIQSLEKHGWNLKSEEQDAHEFFNMLSTTIEEEINKNNKTTKGISIDEQATTSVCQPNSSSPFRGYLASQLCCLSCGHKSVRYDAFECLSIPLPKLDMRNAFTMLNVEGLLKQFLAAETVGEVQCDSCSLKNGKSVFLKQLSLGKLPQCLCLHIQRCDWTITGQLTKRQDLVKFNEELNVGKFVYTNRISGNFKPVTYRLRAVVEHLGMADSGHFVTFRRNIVDGRTRWFYTSDTFTRTATFDEVLKSSPYMLFYERCT
ncbi:ubiquitin carboxyl-terminal hydrolase 30 homolog [Daphnia carinata]|uniref:ubiquitin carboxyl-terminal hydrolase 30 homolog n=1 Tax=Daphnia carinata TaxID=120202 RepID=UPI00257F30BF|nr:ubiquitin carboxyl-terminal hydrolase 30 homolog [Daphnia carinata]